MEQTEQVLKELVAVLIEFPYPQVCKHWAALEVLNAMELLDIKVDDKLAKAVCDADDDTALQLLASV